MVELLRFMSHLFAVAIGPVNERHNTLDEKGSVGEKFATNSTLGRKITFHDSTQNDTASVRIKREEHKTHSTA